MSPAEQDELDRQWETAVAAAARLDTAAKANAAGYFIASTNAPGVGVHFVNWELIDKPFDPAAPSMLLFDMSGADPVLAGFSYWLRSDVPPAGFAGANDHWHQHSGLCIVNGWVDREEVEGPSLCGGSYLGGRDLWMLHAWVAPGFANRWGDFVDTNPLLCPPVAARPTSRGARAHPSWDEAQFAHEHLQLVRRHDDRVRRRGRGPAGRDAAWLRR